MKQFNNIFSHHCYFITKFSTLKIMVNFLQSYVRRKGTRMRMYLGANDIFRRTRSGTNKLDDLVWKLVLQTTNHSRPPRLQKHWGARGICPESSWSSSPLYPPLSDGSVGGQE